MDYKKEALNVLQEISTALDHFTEQENPPGLLSGYTGCALFYAYYYNLTGKKKYIRKVHSLLLKSIHALSEESLIPNHCNGVSGIVWCIRHLLNAGFASDEGIEDIFEDVDVLLGEIMVQEVGEGRYDFLHEALGLALYFLEKKQPSQYLDALTKKLAEKTINGVWEDDFSKASLGRPDETVFNLGMAHGIPSIISILALIDKKNPLIDPGVNWLLATRNTPEEGISSIFPVLVDINKQAVTGKQSRLGWCYGDLSIATALLNAGYTTEAHEIFTYTLQHRDMKNGGVHDACLCHGSAGIAHMYRRAYLATNDPELLLGADHWIKQTLQMKSGLKFSRDGEYETAYGMLEGMTGIGLALIAALDPDTAPAWDRCLLLS